MAVAAVPRSAADSQFRIEATGPFHEPRTRILKHGDTFAVLSQFGDMVGDAGCPDGLYHQDTRFLSQLELRLNGDCPLLLSSNQAEDNSLLPVDLANADTIAVDGSDVPFQRRFVQAFVSAWRREGGAVPREYRFEANPELLSALRRELAAQPIDAVLLAVDANDAALAKSFLRGRVYASSQITDELPPQMLFDLENVRYIEIPWLAEPDSPAFAGMPRAAIENPVLERLYALGIDAFALAQMLAEPTPPERIELDGATGHLSLLRSRAFEREGRVMSIHDGRVLAEPPGR